MSVLWRISNRADLEGIGGEKSDGRWHTAARGKRIVYLAEHPAVALVEVLANLHTSPGLLPDTYQLMKVLTPAQLPLQVLSPDLLTVLWRDHPRETQSIGDDWLAKCSSPLLVVPSAPAPESQNCLLNPLHPDSRLLTMEWCRRMKHDRRLFRISEPPASGL